MAKGFTPRQQAFIASVASGSMDYTEAAVSAGYSPHTAKSTGSKLMMRDDIRAEVDRIRAKATAVAQGSKTEALDIIWDTLKGAAKDGDRPNVYKGAELWLKATGQLVEKQQIEQTSTIIDIEWDGISGGMSQ